MSRTRLLVASLAVMVTLAGCGIGQGQVRRQVFRPGSWEFQKRRAIRFDPYSQIELGTGPRDSTTRPRDYYRPIPEPARGRWQEWGAPRYGYP